ncbi:MAG TPA: GAF domain-containing protein [Solirubrobacterales bacterium]|nr:GAF domain-containing protein [Solirubrobacterales bacterium]
MSSSAEDLAARLESVRLESNTLYDVIGAIASSPDLDPVLNGVVDALTRATSSHACFVYLRHGERLRLRAASPLYAHLVGTVEFGVDEGLAGWALRENRPAFVRENALGDPRTIHVPELDEEDFQSMAAIPIPSRRGGAMGAIVLHTIAPREFDDGTLNLLTHVAPLVAGVIENARLYADARRRVAALTALSALSQRIAAVEDRAALYRVTSDGVAALLDCEEVHFYELDADRSRLRLVSTARADGPDPVSAPALPASTSEALVELSRANGTATAARVRGVLQLDPALEYVVLAPVAAGDEDLGLLLAAGGSGWAGADDAEELLSAVANQTAVALKKADLIERLTEEYVVHDLFIALEEGEASRAEARARQAFCDLEQPHVFVLAAAAADGGVGEVRTENIESGLRRLFPGALCDAAEEAVRALLPLSRGGTAEELEKLDGTLTQLAEEDGIVIGRSEVHRGAAEGGTGLREAGDALHVATALLRGGGLRAYSDIGAYRYLVHLLGQEAVRDPYSEAIATLTEYDRARGSELVQTLETYLEARRGITETARSLTVHPNTLRQRLERIESLTGLDLASADLLSLELALRLERLRSASG